MIIFFSACTKGDIQRQHGCCATDLTSGLPAASWFDCFLLCEKNHDCEYFQFVEDTYSGMAEQRVVKTKKNCKIIFSHWISDPASHNQCLLKKDTTGSTNTVTGIRGGFLHDCKSKYILNCWNDFLTALWYKKGHKIYI